MVVLVNAPSAYKAAIASKGAALKLGDFMSGTLSTVAIDQDKESEFSSLYAKNTLNSGNFMMVNDKPYTKISFPLQHDRGALTPFPVGVERIVSKVEV